MKRAFLCLVLTMTLAVCIAAPKAQPSEEEQQKTVGDMIGAVMSSASLVQGDGNYAIAMNRNNPAKRIVVIRKRKSDDSSQDVADKKVLERSRFDSLLSRSIDGQPLFEPRKSKRIWPVRKNVTADNNNEHLTERAPQHKRKWQLGKNGPKEDEISETDNYPEEYKRRRIIQRTRTTEPPQEITTIISDSRNSNFRIEVPDYDDDHTTEDVTSTNLERFTTKPPTTQFDTTQPTRFDHFTFRNIFESSIKPTSTVSTRNYSPFSFSSSSTIFPTNDYETTTTKYFNPSTANEIPTTYPTFKPFEFSTPSTEKSNNFNQRNSFIFTTPSWATTRKYDLTTAGISTTEKPSEKTTSSFILQNNKNYDDLSKFKIHNQFKLDPVTNDAEPQTIVFTDDVLLSLTPTDGKPFGKANNKKTKVTNDYFKTLSGQLDGNVAADANRKRLISEIQKSVAEEDKVFILQPAKVEEYEDDALERILATKEPVESFESVFGLTRKSQFSNGITSTSQPILASGNSDPIPEVKEPKVTFQNGRFVIDVDDSARNKNINLKIGANLGPSRPSFQSTTSAPQNNDYDKQEDVQRSTNSSRSPNQFYVSNSFKISNDFVDNTTSRGFFSPTTSSSARGFSFGTAIDQQKPINNNGFSTGFSYFDTTTNIPNEVKSTTPSIQQETIHLTTQNNYQNIFSKDGAKNNFFTTTPSTTRLNNYSPFNYVNPTTTTEAFTNKFYSSSTPSQESTSQKSTNGFSFGFSSNFGQNNYFTPTTQKIEETTGFEEIKPTNFNLEFGASSSFRPFSFSTRENDLSGSKSEFENKFNTQVPTTVRSNFGGFSRDFTYSTTTTPKVNLNNNSPSYGIQENDSFGQKSGLENKFNANAVKNTETPTTFGSPLGGFSRDYVYSTFSTPKVNLNNRSPSFGVQESVDLENKSNTNIAETTETPTTFGPTFGGFSKDYVYTVSSTPKIDITDTTIIPSTASSNFIGFSKTYNSYNNPSTPEAFSKKSNQRSLESSIKDSPIIRIETLPPPRYVKNYRSNESFQNKNSFDTSNVNKTISDVNTNENQKENSINSKNDENSDRRNSNQRNQGPVSNHQTYYINAAGEKVFQEKPDRRRKNNLDSDLSIAQSIAYGSNFDDQDELTRGSKRYQPTKFETISPFISDSHYRELYQNNEGRRVTHAQDELLVREKDLNVNDNSLYEKGGKNAKGNSYRGNVKFKFDPYSIDYEEDNSIYPDQFGFRYNTSNGISAFQKGVAKTINNHKVYVVHGSYQYTAPDGTPIFVNYTADEKGFRTQESYLPTFLEEPQKSTKTVASTTENEDILLPETTETYSTVDDFEYE